MIKALILSIAILAVWLVVGLARTPAAPLAAPEVARIVAPAFVNTQTTVLQPGTRGPVIQL